MERLRRSALFPAALYAAGLALGAEALSRTSFWLLYAEEGPVPAPGAEHDRRDHTARS